MQTPPKKSVSKNGTSEVPRKTSPVTPSTRRSITAESEPDPAASTGPVIKTPTKMSPKAPERKSPRSPVSRSPILERKHSGRINELETQLAILQAEMRKAKDQLAYSESLRIKAEQEKEEVMKQSIAAAEKLEDTQRQLKELAESEDERVEELRKIGQERDEVWQSELEAVKKQHTVDSTALFCAVNEVQRLKLQLEVATSSENAKAKKVEVADAELKSLKLKMEETLCLVENLRNQVEEAEKTEEEYQMLIHENQVQVEMAKDMIDMLKSHSQKVTEAFNSVVSELEKSNARVSSLEQILRNSVNSQVANDVTAGSHDESECCPETGLHSLQLEVEQLKTALEMALVRHHEEAIKHAVEVQSAYEEVVRIKVKNCHQQAQLQSMIEEARLEVAELKVSLADKEVEIQSLHSLREKPSAGKDIHSEKESDLDSKLAKSASQIAELETVVRGKESEIRNILAENRILKLEIERIEMEKTKQCESAMAEADMARASEQEALAKIGIINEEADKSLRRVARATEQLEAAQAANLEMEAELRRLRIQSDQWRKAAETAAAILASGNNGKLMERSGSFPDYSNVVGGKLLNSPFSDDIDDESPKKKSNVLKKFGGLWKKSQK